MVRGSAVVGQGSAWVRAASNRRIMAWAHGRKAQGRLAGCFISKAPAGVPLTTRCPQAACGCLMVTAQRVSCPVGYSVFGFAVSGADSTAASAASRVDLASSGKASDHDQGARVLRLATFTCRAPFPVCWSIRRQRLP